MKMKILWTWLTKYLKSIEFKPLTDNKEDNAVTEWLDFERVDLLPLRCYKYFSLDYTVGLRYKYLGGARCENLHEKSVLWLTSQ